MQYPVKAFKGELSVIIGKARKTMKTESSMLVTRRNFGKNNEKINFKTASLPSIPF